jgi:hypothetical protein
MNVWINSLAWIVLIFPGYPFRLHATFTFAAENHVIRGRHIGRMGGGGGGSRGGGRLNRSVENDDRSGIFRRTSLAWGNVLARQMM